MSEHSDADETLERVRLYAETLIRTSTHEARAIGADLLAILEGPNAPRAL